MTTPELMRAFRLWWDRRNPATFLRSSDCYPLYIGAPANGRWYVRERLPGTRVWRAEEDGSFVLLSSDLNSIAVSY